jgi:FkbM family methyltransferase
MTLRHRTRALAARLFRSRKGQQLLDRAASHIDMWRGYGSGAYVDSSGEGVLFELLRKRVRTAPKLIICDVGANVGGFSRAALNALGENVTIHAFEPARETFIKLSENFRGDARIIINNVAVGSNESEQALFAAGGDSGMASLLPRKFSGAAPAAFQETVKVIPLSDYCASGDVEHIDLLKVDVEGFELEVLAGAEPLFREGRISLCSFEFGGCNLDSRTFLRDFFDFFRAHKMEISRIAPGGTVFRLPHYGEQLEKFTTTNYVAIQSQFRSA